MTSTHNDEVRQVVRDSYAQIAEQENPSQACCSTDYSDKSSCCQPVQSNNSPADSTARELGYSDKELAQVPEGANMGLGCGNPQAIAALKPGENVLDLGSGGGFDCFLAAQQVGPTGRVIGVDMTQEMVSKARHNVTKTQFDNVEFRLGEIEHLPVADNSIDVIISNCVINLSPDKQSVFNEAFRVLKPDGRLAISDVVTSAPLPEAVVSDMALHSGCVAGASPVKRLHKLLEKAGFSRVSIKPKDELQPVLDQWAPNTDISNYLMSATIEAYKA